MNEQAQSAAGALVASLEEYVAISAAQQEMVERARAHAQATHERVMRRLGGDLSSGTEAPTASAPDLLAIRPEDAQASQQVYTTATSLANRQVTALSDADRALLQLAIFPDLQEDLLAIHERIRGIRLLVTEPAPTEIERKMSDFTPFPRGSAAELQSLSPEERKERMRAMSVPFLASMHDRHQEYQAHFDVQAQRQEQYLSEALEMARRVLARIEGSGSEAP